MELLKKISDGRWGIIASEWSILPPGDLINLDPAYTSISTDMAAAIHIAGMFGVFWQQGVMAAQYFELLGRGPKSREGEHFHLVSLTDEKKYVLNPTGEVFRLYGRYFRGDRLHVMVDSPSFIYRPFESDQEIKVPILLAHAAYEPQKKQMVVILSNRHQDAPAPFKLELANFEPLAQEKILKIVVSAKGPLSCEAVVTNESVELPVEENTNIQLPYAGGKWFSYQTIELPPHSVTALVIKGHQTSPKPRQSQKQE